MTKKYTEEETKLKLFNKHGDKVKIVKFNGFHKYSDFECNICGNKWIAKPSTILKSNLHGCGVCYEKIRGDMSRTPYDEIKKYIESKNCELLSLEYKSQTDKIDIKYPCGHINHMGYISFKAGSECRNCSYEKISSAKRVPSKIDQIIKDNNFIFIDYPDGYKNRKSIIRFECDKGHFVETKIGCFLDIKSCKICGRLKGGRNRSGELGPGWRGGITQLRGYLRDRITDWKNETMRICDYKCSITQGNFDVIHHLYSFNLILQEALENLKMNYNIMSKVSEFNQETLDILTKEIQELHVKYGPGVLMRRDLHKKLHQCYGRNDVTPEQFYEFKQKVLSGEIVID